MLSCVGLWDRIGCCTHAIRHTSPSAPDGVKTPLSNFDPGNGSDSLAGTWSRIKGVALVGDLLKMNFSGDRHTPRGDLRPTAPVVLGTQEKTYTNMAAAHPYDHSQKLNYKLGTTSAGPGADRTDKLEHQVPDPDAGRLFFGQLVLGWGQLVRVVIFQACSTGCTRCYACRLVGTLRM